MHLPAGGYFMKSLISALLVFLASAHPTWSDDTNRYQISVGDKQALMVDTKTGRTWILRQANYQEGAPSEQLYEWSPIRFPEAKAPVPKDQ
jgi:hypothetical protein